MIVEVSAQCMTTPVDNDHMIEAGNGWGASRRTWPLV